MHASQFVQNSEYKTVLTIKKNVHFSLATENTVIAIILKSHFIFLLGSAITQYTTAQPNREETAAIVSLSFSSKDVRNW